MARLYKACPQDSTTDLCEAEIAVRALPPTQETNRSAPQPTLLPSQHKR
jgi:hypothetical protein